MKSTTISQELKQLAGDPQAHAQKAITYLNRKEGRDAQLAALAALVKVSETSAHGPLLSLYEYYSAKGPKRDAGAHMRRAILDALRPIAQPADLPLLLQAAATYEFLPPSFGEDAVLLRGGALLILNELDDELAAYHAARLLVDEYTQTMSGEPALTAVRVLHSQGQLLPLFQYAMHAQTTLPDITSECLRCLTALPLDIIPTIVTRHEESSHSAVRLGLYDLLLGHEEGPQALDYLASALVAEKDQDLFRYLLIAIFSSRKAELLSLVKQTASLEANHERLAIIKESAELFAGVPDVDGIAARLKEKVD